VAGGEGESGGSRQRETEGLTMIPCETCAGFENGCLCGKMYDWINAQSSIPSTALLAKLVHGGYGPDYYEIDLPQGGLLVIGPDGVDYFRDREIYDRDAGYHPDDSLVFANDEVSG